MSSSKRTLIIFNYLRILFWVALVAIIAVVLAPLAGMEGLANVMGVVFVLCVLVIPIVMSYGFVSSKISRYIRSKRSANEGD